MALELIYTQKIRKCITGYASSVTINALRTLLIFAVFFKGFPFKVSVCFFFISAPLRPPPAGGGAYAFYMPAAVHQISQFSWV